MGEEQAPSQLAKPVELFSEKALLVFYYKYKIFCTDFFQVFIGEKTAFFYLLSMS